MQKICRLAFAVLCMAALFAGTAAWAAEGGPVANPVVGAEAPLFTPAPELKGCTFRCISGFTTAINGGPSDWGMGSSCAVAQSALTAALFDRADANCYSRGYEDGVCGTITQVTTTACYFNGTMFQVDAYANHSCGRTICIEKEPYQQ